MLLLGENNCGWEHGGNTTARENDVIIKDLSSSNFYYPVKYGDTNGGRPSPSELTRKLTAPSDMRVRLQTEREGEREMILITSHLPGGEYVVDGVVV